MSRTNINKRGQRGSTNGPTSESRGRADRRFQNVLKQLPDSATAAKELDWIKNHPKMVEHDRSGDPNHRVVLSCKDIKDAPSKHAAQALQHWVNRPNEFFKNMLTEDKKRLGEDNEPAPEDYPEIREIDELLLTLKGAVRPGEPVVISQAPQRT